VADSLGSARCAPKYTRQVKLASLRTPAVLVEQLKLERNIERMQTAADAAGKKLRPHAKTHKSPDLAAIQVARGAAGICCAKLGEAEVFADSIADIRLPYPINPVNADRAIALLDRTRLSFIVDDLDVARGWSAAMRGANREVDVLVKVDVGFHRCGIDPDPERATDVIVRVAELPGLRFRGLLAHAGHAYGASSAEETSAIADDEARILTGLRDRVIDRGVEVEEISVGATPTARFSVKLPGITELRPGNYVYYDRMQVAVGSATWDDCAMTVLARVVSRPATDRIILDSGSKTLTNDVVRGPGSVPGYGVVLTALDSSTPDGSLVIERLSEEHATVRVTGASALKPGDLVRIVPNHACPVTNLVDEVWIVDGTEVTDRLEIAARGRIT
jgi:D-serine deaminase-like pyridoxal phosphate-dependent protein